MKKVLLIFLLLCASCSVATKAPHVGFSPSKSELTDLMRTTPVEQNFFSNCNSDDKGEIRQTTYIYKTLVSPNSEHKVELRAYVFYPPAQTHIKQQSAVAMFHGGAWTDGYPMTWFPAAIYYASRGFLTVSFQYRIQRVHGSTPQQSVADAKSAYRWLVRNSEFLHVDPKSIVVAGDSAGAHIALGISLFDQISDEAPNQALHPRAVVALYPVVDSTLAGVGGLSPIAALTSSNLPQTFIVQGAFDADYRTPPEKTKAFCQTANQISSRTVCQTKFFQDPSYFHGFIGARSQYLATLDELNRFFAEQKLVSSYARIARSMPESCVAPADGTLFGSWLKKFGYTSSTSSLWK